MKSADFRAFYFVCGDEAERIPTFARKYLVDCGGDAFTLQRLMGHSTLKMTKHYCSIYDADIAKNYDRVSPLAQIQKPRETIKNN